MECVVRPAQSTDCDHVMGMIREIAEYHNLLDEVTINSQVLRDDGFGGDPFYQCLIAELAPEQEDKQGHLIGYVLFFFGYSMNSGRIVYVENLYVVSEFRGRGIGKKLLSEIGKAVLARVCTEMKFMVAAWNSQALAWYRHLGAQDKMEASDWHGFELGAKALRRLAGDGQ
ncbi:thialysine N-epsilon-acetyltransferase-like [Dermochelys coriacea]|uniref:thialysine N-epsilon-acetyltransferase-like n=1 Tax=Dermochelys coriacea TaxID=27794 RepID=UPI001CA9C330|nr:thialysine N-epsilon-acetyltransferase-like [Dermochelys coriacea]